MSTYFNSEFKRAFFTKRMLFINILVLLVLLLPALTEVRHLQPGEDSINFFIRIGAFLPNSYLPLLAPILVCIPFANSYVLENESGIDKFIYTKITTKKYLNTKLLVNALVSGLSLVIPQILCDEVYKIKKEN